MPNAIHTLGSFVHLTLFCETNEFKITNPLWETYSQNFVFPTKIVQWDVYTKKKIKIRNAFSCGMNIFSIDGIIHNSYSLQGYILKKKFDK